MDVFMRVILFGTCLSLVASEGIPISFYQRLNALNISSPQEFVRLLRKEHPGISRGDDSGLFDASGRPNHRAYESVSNVPEADRCEPKITSVPFPPDPNPNAFLYPICVHLKRCGGCCGHGALRCVPTESRIIQVETTKTVFSSLTDMTVSFWGTVTYPLEVHSGCVCRCATQPGDCNPTLQTYHAGDCRCKCKNEDTEMGRCNSLQRWDASLCQCMCMRVTNCESGMYFNTATCQCELPVRARENNNLPSSGGSSSGSSGSSSSNADPCATLKCRPSYVKQRSGNNCRCVFDLFGRR